MKVTYDLPPLRPNGPPRVETADFSPVGDRYTDLRFLGNGAYGVVVAARTTQPSSSSRPTFAENTSDSEATNDNNNNQVAIKMVTLIGGCRMYLLVLRELRILTRLQHENIIDIHDVIVSKPLRKIFIVQSLMDCDLDELLKGQTLSKECVCHFVYQLLRALKFIHSANIFHRDLKPSNILVSFDQKVLKICDFGLARLVEPEVQNRHQLTEYVATRWYRAPEIALNPCAYSQAVDMWSLGCVFGEMLSGRPLFPGKTLTKQIDKIVAVLGTPSEAELDSMDMSTHTRTYVNRLPKSEKQPWHNVFGVPPPLDADLTDLLDKLLTFLPQNRITAADALKHNYVKIWHNPENEPVCKETITFEPGIENFTIRQLEQLLMDEIDCFRKRREMRGAANIPANTANESPFGGTKSDDNVFS